MATKADIDKWIAEQGGPDAVVWSYDDVEVPDPRGMRNLPDGTENTDYDRAFKDKKITVRRETWTNKTTKAAYSGTRTPYADDQFQDIKQSGPTQAANAATQKPTGGHEGPEGTPTGRTNPDGSPEHDNTRPRWVIRGPKNEEVFARPLTAQEREQWEREKNNGKTDAEVRGDTGKPRQSRVNPADPTKIQEFDPTTGQWVDAGVNAAGVQAAAGTSKRYPDKVHPGYSVVETTKDGKTEQHYEKDDAPGVAVSPPTDKPTRIEKPYQHDDGKTYTQVTEKDPVTQVERTFYLDASGKEVTLPQKGLANIPDGAPPLDMSTAQTAYDSAMRYQAWLDAQYRAKKMTAEQVKEAYAPAHQQATMVIEHERDRRAQEQQGITNALTQRSQDTTQTANRLTNSTSQFATALTDAEKTNQLAGPGIGAAGNTLFGTLALQQMFSNQMGGLRESPQVVVPGPVANLPTYPGAVPSLPAAPSAQGIAAQGAAVQAQQTAAPATPPAAPVVPYNPGPGEPGSDPSRAYGMVRDPSDTVTIRSASGATMTVPRFMVGEGPGQYGSTPARGGYQLVPAAAPQAQQHPTYGMPVMALASSFSGQPSYDPAIASLRALGLSDETIQQALHAHVNGVA